MQRIFGDRVSPALELRLTRWAMRVAFLSALVIGGLFLFVQQMTVYWTAACCLWIGIGLHGRVERLEREESDRAWLLAHQQRTESRKFLISGNTIVTSGWQGIATSPHEEHHANPT